MKLGLFKTQNIHKTRILLGKINLEPNKAFSFRLIFRVEIC